MWLICETYESLLSMVSGSRGPTFNVGIINVQQGEVITIWVGEHSLRGVCLLPLIWWSQPDVRNYTNQSAPEYEVRMDIPDNIDTMVRISLLHLNSGLTMSIFDIWGSRGNSAMRPPKYVRFPSSSSAAR